MSHIAEALAKAKERTGHTTAPFLPGAPKPDPAIQLARARRHQRMWIALLSFAALGTALLIWQRLGDTPTSTAPAATSEPSLPPPAAPVESPSLPPAQLGSPDQPALPVTPTPTAAPAPAPAIARTVQALAITAVLPGERPRLVLQGRIVAVGEAAAPGLIFSGVRDQHLIFTDTRGATYERKY